MTFGQKLFAESVIFMKALKFLFILAVAASLLVSCAPPTEENMNTVKMTAKINSITDRLEVEVIEGEYGASGIYWVLFNADTVFLDKNGNKTTLLYIKEGDTVEISYGGQVMMSYPPQIVALTVQVR